jgi:hypothetical protein
MHLAHYLGLLHKAQVDLAAGYRAVGRGHREEPDVAHICETLARDCDAHAEALEPFAARYGEDAPAEPDALHAELFRGTRSGPIGLLRDLHDLYVMAAYCDMAWTLVGQASRGARDEELQEVVTRFEGDAATQMKWLRTRMKQAAPQALVVAD